jgi:hypothetical protein
LVRLAYHSTLPSEIAPARVSRLLTAAEFHQLADVPPEEYVINSKEATTFERPIRGRCCHRLPLRE